MQQLKAVFKDNFGLHARIDAYLRRSSVLKIGLVPFRDRGKTCDLLNALIDEPIQSTQWSAAVAKRPLTKDVMVVQSPSFEFVETHNSIIIYPVPFSGPALEYLEVCSAKDSWDHLKQCHLHLLLTDRLNDIPPKSHYPSLTVIDSHGDAVVPLGQTENSINAAIDYSSEPIRVNSKKALTANSQLQESPSNVSVYSDLRKASGIDHLKSLFNPPKVYEALKASIINTCQSQIAEIQSDDHGRDNKKASDAAKWRHEWTQMAHEELQGSLLPRLREGLYGNLSFYKLYARTDDVESVITHIVEHSLPNTQAHFQFLMGKLSIDRQAESAAIANSLARTLEPATLDLQNRALRAVLSSLLGIQLPLVALSMAGLAFGGFGWFSMGALASLGIVSGLKRLQTEWIRSCRNYELLVKDEALKSIKSAELQLWETGEKSIHLAENLKHDMETALAEAVREM